MLLGHLDRFLGLMSRQCILSCHMVTGSMPAMRSGKRHALLKPGTCCLAFKQRNFREANPISSQAGPANNDQPAELPGTSKGVGVSISVLSQDGQCRLIANKSKRTGWKSWASGTRRLGASSLPRQSSTPSARHRQSIVRWLTEILLNCFDSCKQHV